MSLSGADTLPRDSGRGAIFIDGMSHLVLWLSVPILHAVGAVHLLTSHVLAGVTLLLAGQCALAISLIWSTDRALLFHDIRLFFVAGYTLYGLTNPLGILFLDVHPSKGIAEAVALFALGLLGFNLAQLLRPVAFDGMPNAPLKSKRLDVFVSLVLPLLCIVIFAYAIKLGKTVSLGQIMGSRVSTESSDQAWVVLSFLMQGLSCFAIYAFRQLGAAARLVAVCSIALWMLLHIGMGNRRDFMPVIVFGIAYLASVKRIRLNMIYVCLLAAGLLGFLYMGILRLNTEINIDRGDLLRLVASENEFAIPIQTAAFYATSPDYQFRMGSTYAFLLPAYLIPRQVWPEKPVSLGVQFVVDAFGTSKWQGYAYTPVTEAFINFGWPGPFCVLLVFSVLLNLAVARSHRNFGLYLILFATMMDFNRGEVPGVLYQLIFIAGAYVAACYCTRSCVLRPLGQE